jgi:hypothetical protein
LRPANYTVIAAVACCACCLGAVPSFILSSDFNLLGRLAGVGVFVVAYAAAVYTPLFASWWSRPRIRRALMIGYAARAGASIVFPFGMFLDLWCGMLSAKITGLYGARDSATFVQVFATTVIQGIVLHGPLACFVLFLYAVIPDRLDDDEPRGHAFEVIPLAKPSPAPAAPVEPDRR